VLHWIRHGAVIFAVWGLCIAAGCGRNERAAAEAQRPAPKPAEKKPALPIGGSVRAVEITLTDPKGVVRARVKADEAQVGRSGKDAAAAAGALVNGTATLHDDAGKPSATLRADRLRVDQAERTVTGVGDVVARALAQPGSPSVRADRVVWHADDDTIRGDGSVVITRDGVRIPARAFVADTRLRQVRLSGSDVPATVSRKALRP
jgi:hypothetical protein